MTATLYARRIFPEITVPSSLLLAWRDQRDALDDVEEGDHGEAPVEPASG